MLLDVAFHPGLHYQLRFKQSTKTEIHVYDHILEFVLVTP